MKKDRDKFLTEAMGWEQVQAAIMPSAHMWFHDPAHPNPTVRFPVNFSTWEGFGKLWEWADKQTWIYDFTRSLDTKVHGLPLTYIHPDHFADALYSFLKER